MVADSMEIKVVVSLLLVTQDIKLLVPFVVKLLTLILLVALWLKEVDQLLLCLNLQQMNISFKDRKDFN